MTFKLIGAACVALAAGSTLRTIFIQRRQEECVLRQMAAALDTMAREIRWQQRAICDIFSTLSKEPVTGKYFSEILEMLKIIISKIRNY